MTQEKLDIILDKHRKWLNNEDGGERADLSGAYLYGVDFREADLRKANLSRADLRQADLNKSDIREADLSGADLSGAFLYRADLKGANIDYSCLPLWCGSLKAHFDDRQLKQIAYHLVCAGLHSKNASEGTKRELVKILDFANGFHRAEECGILKNPFEDKGE